jgi:hypothetical protein
MTTSALPTRRPSGPDVSSRLRRPTVTALLTAALLGAGGAVAAAAPPPPEPTCDQVLAGAVTWPGSMQLQGQTYHLYSDAYYSSLLRRPACTQPAA